MVSENLINSVNIISLILLFSSISYVVYKKKYDTALTLGILTFLFIVFKFILKVF